MIITREDVEKGIATLLRDYEASSGNVVDSISLGEIDITKLTDNRQVLACHVRVNIHRPPAHGWAQAKKEQE